MSWSNLHQQSQKAKSVPELEVALQDTLRLLSCTKCKAHMKKYMEDNPIPASSDDYFTYTWALQNSVNKMLGKASMPLEIARDRHAKPRRPRSLFASPFRFGASFAAQTVQQILAAGARPVLKSSSCNCQK